MTNTAPMSWRDALRVTAERRFVSLDDCPIAVREWQLGMAEDAPLILLVHGQGAHSHWWDCLAPPLGIDCGMRVAALDLAGMGDSGHRDRYSLRQFAAELLRTVESCRPGGPVLVAAHSFGGSVARTALHLWPDALAGCVLLDSALGRGRPTVAAKKVVRRETRIYASREEALRRFRLSPAQPPPDAALLRHVAEHSIRRAGDGGWQFKLDTRMRYKLVHEDFGEPLEQLRAGREKYRVIYGGNSIFFKPNLVDRLQGVLSPEAVRVLDGAHHQLFLDRPDDCRRLLAACIRELI